MSFSISFVRQFVLRAMLAILCSNSLERYWISSSVMTANCTCWSGELGFRRF